LLNEKEKEKYNRQLIIPGFGSKGQHKLKSSKVLVVGLGGLGSSVLYYLASAGIGTIGIIDKDNVELSNLNRQILHNEDNLNQPKTDSASEKIQKMNADIKIIPYNETLGIPFVIGGVLQFEGQLMTVLPRKSACYRCIFKELPEKGSYPTTDKEGIIGTVAGLFGIIEANEAIKYIVFEDPEKLLTNKILYIELKSNNFEVYSIQRDDNCIICSKNNDN
jgi:molybdopterin/thiamine biosynthesis adenylyltransferase